MAKKIKFKNKPKQPKVYIKDWLVLKPYSKQQDTDSFYLKIANRVCKVLFKYNINYDFIDNSDECIKALSCFLTSYFEDIISGTNIWKTFVNTHYKLYNKKLPFYITDRYFDNKCNKQDIQFLLWYFFNTYSDTLENHIYVYHNNPLFEDVTLDILEIFDEAFQYAPKNEFLKTFYQIDENETDYYIARDLLSNFFFKSYLFHYDIYFDLIKSEIELIKNEKFRNNFDNDMTTPILNENHDVMLYNEHSRLLSLKAQEWVAELLGYKHPLSKHYRNIVRIRDFFLYKGEDDKNLLLEHIASGKQFKMTKKSFDYIDIPEKINTIMFIGLALWRNEWWFSGSYLPIPYNQKKISEQKKSIESLNNIKQIELEFKKKSEEILKNHFESFKKFNNGSLIKFLPAGKIDEFCKDFMRFHNNSLKLTEKEKSEQDLLKEKYSIGKNDFDVSEKADSGFVFFNPKAGIEVGVGLNSAFPFPDNPYFNEKESSEDILNLIIRREVSAEVVKFCIEHAKDKLTFFTEDFWKGISNDLDFLLRFFKKDKYHSKSMLLITM